MSATLAPSFAQLKKTFLDSGYEIRLLPARDLERMALDLPLSEKRHIDTDIKGLILHDENSIGIVRDLDVDERATTLLHELIHLYSEDMDEEDVEELTIDMEQRISDKDFGFLQFLVS